MSNSGGMHSPVEQFEIKPLVELSLGGFDISFTNSSLFMLLAMVKAPFFLSLRCVAPTWCQAVCKVRQK